MTTQLGDTSASSSSAFPWALEIIANPGPEVPVFKQLPFPMLVRVTAPLKQAQRGGYLMYKLDAKISRCQESTLTNYKIHEIDGGYLDCSNIFWTLSIDLKFGDFGDNDLDLYLQLGTLDKSIGIKRLPRLTACENPSENCLSLDASNFYLGLPQYVKDKLMEDEQNKRFEEHLHPDAKR